MITKLLKKGSRFFFAVVAAIAVLGCEPRESDPDNIPKVLRIQAENSRPGALQTSVKVSVFCDIKWSASISEGSWARIENLVVNEGTGGTFNLTFSPNLERGPREAVIKVTAGQGETTATVTQDGVDAFFQPSTITLTGTDFSNVSFTSPQDWTAKVSSGEDWINLRTKSGNAGAAVITLAARDANINVGSRSGSVTVTFGGSVNLEIPVVQGQKDVILSEDSKAAFDWKGGQFTVLTQSNVDYKIECSGDWIEHMETKALNEAAEYFRVKPNDDVGERSAEIRFTGGGATLSVKVEQGGKDPILNVSKAGFYGILGKDYVLGEGGWNQYGSMESPGGALTIRLMNRAELSVISTEGINSSAKAGDSFNIGVTLRKEGKSVMQGDYYATVLDSDEGLLWMKVSPDVYFIVKM